MPVIWGRTNSINVHKVLWCCEELAVDYDRIDAGGAFGVVNTPDYRKLNPNGLVPTLVDGTFVLWESNAIVRYLAATHGPGGLWPNDPRRRADADRWMDWHITTFGPAFQALFLGLVRTPPEQRNAQTIENSRLKTAEVLQLVDAHLATHPFLAGDTFTMGDIPLGCGVWRWMTLPIERPEYPNLDRWFATLKARPAYQKIVMHPLT